MKSVKKIWLCFFLLQYIVELFSQTYNVTGFVKSEYTNEPVIFAYCYSDDLKFHTICNEDGFFHLKIPGQEIKLIFSHVSYESDTIVLKTIKKDTTLLIGLKDLTLDEAVITSKETSFIDQSITGKITISPLVIRNLPSSLGEPDLIKTISFLPGVSTGNKLYSNLYVRGGGRQNNLILVDDAPTYNSNHVFGLISVFNADVVQQLDFYKSDFPARYGGATSSIVDVYIKEGNFSEYSGKLKTSILYSKLFAEGPIIKDRFSFLLSGRCSYFDMLMIPFYSLYNTSGNISFPGYRFYDINSKITYKLSPNQKINLSFFHGNDRYSVFDKNKYDTKPYNSEVKNHSRNTTLSMQYKTRFFSTSYLRLSATYSKYKNIFDSSWETKDTVDREGSENYYFSSIENLSFKSQIDFKPGINHDMKVGWKSSLYYLQPGYSKTHTVSPAEDINYVSGDKKLLKAIENVFYIENDYSISDKFVLNTGLRNVLYKNDITVCYLEPRISLRYKPKDNLSFKLGYSLMNQTLQCITNNTQQTGSEFWLLSNAKFPSEISHHYNTGFSMKLPYNIELTTDLYFKKGMNSIYYNFVGIDQNFLDNYNELIYRNGKSLGYGAEIMLRKQTERFQSLFAYTFSRSFIEFDDLNQGKKFPTQQDKLHDISFVFLYKLNDINSFNVNFTFNSGAPITLPVAYINQSTFYGGYYVYDGINNKRLPAFHRLDVSWVRTKYTRKNRKRIFYLNLYNAYAKQNAVYMFFANNKAYKTAVNLIIPSIGYEWYF